MVTTDELANIDVYLLTCSFEIGILLSGGTTRTVYTYSIHVFTVVITYIESND